MVVNTAPIPFDVLVVEDDPFFQRVLGEAVVQARPAAQLHYARSAEQAAAFGELPDARLDLALVDLGLPDLDGLAVIRRLRGRFPDVAVVVVSVFADEARVLEAIRSGAVGYVLKGDPHLPVGLALEQILSGVHPISPALARFLFKRVSEQQTHQDSADPRLTKRETELLSLLAEGNTYADAALQMGVALSTIQTHIRNLYRKLGVHSQAQAMVKAQAGNLLPPGSGASRDLTGQ